MGRCCSCNGSGAVLAILNLLTLFVSLAMVVTGVTLAAQPGTACERFLDTPLFLSGAFLLVVSLLGLVGACCRVACVLWLYLIILFLLIVALTFFTAAAFVVTNRTAGRAAAGQGYGEYRLGDYSRWLQKVVNDEKNWVNIESCLKEAKLCGGPPLPLPPPPPPVASLLLHTPDFYKIRLQYLILSAAVVRLLQTAAGLRPHGREHQRHPDAAGRERARCRRRLRRRLQGLDQRRVLLLLQDLQGGRPRERPVGVADARPVQRRPPRLPRLRSLRRLLRRPEQRPRQVPAIRRRIQGIVKDRSDPAPRRSGPLAAFFDDSSGESLVKPNQKEGLINFNQCR